jgi:hypothetical protein
VTGSTRSFDPEQGDLAARNRRTARVLLTVLSLLAVATLLVGIRW